MLLLIASNAFMTTAVKYYHLKKAWTISVAIAVSWLIALARVHAAGAANRLGHVQHWRPFTRPQLKVIQEAITLAVFAVFSVTVLKELRGQGICWRSGLIMAGVVVAMWGKK